MTAFYIAPFTPVNWETVNSNLKIDPVWYKKYLSNDWMGVKFYDDIKVWQLAWDIPVTISGSFVYGMLHNDLQIVSLDTPHEEFFLWHRNIISGNYELYLFNDSSPKFLELKLNTTIEDIKQFCGKSSK